MIWVLALLDQNSGCSSLEMIGLNILTLIFWILIRVVGRLKVFDDLEKLFCIACKVIFLVLG